MHRFLRSTFTFFISYVCISSELKTFTDQLKQHFSVGVFTREKEGLVCDGSINAFDQIKTKAKLKKKYQINERKTSEFVYLL